MRHLWFRRFDRRALRRANSELARGPIRVFAEEVDGAAVTALNKYPALAEVFSLMPATRAVEDDAGRNIRVRAEEIRAILARRIAGSESDYGWLPVTERPWGAEWLRVYGAVLHYEIRFLAELLALIENGYRTGTVATPTEAVVELGDHPFAAAVAEHASSILRLTFPVIVGGRSASLVWGALRQLLRLAAQAVYVPLRNALQGYPEVHVEARDEGIVLVEYEKHTFDHLPLGANQDWYEYSKLPPRRLVFFFDRLDSPLTDEVRRKLVERGFGWVDYRVRSRHARRPAAILFHAFRQLLRVFPAPWNIAGLRRWTAIAHLLPSVRMHRAFLKDRKVLAVLQHSEFIPHQMALNLACRQEGAAFVWSFWSVLVFLSGLYQHAFADLLFAWGDYDLGHCNALSFDYRYAVACGVLGYDGGEPGDAERAAEIRGKLSGRPRFVVTVFDSSHAPRALNHSTERCILFYQTVLALVRTNPDWGCVIKSKGSSYSELPETPGVQDVVAELEALGRCVRLPDGTKPTLAALAGDAVVGFSINSAAFQAALGSDKPVLHFDPNHILAHPFYRLGGEGKIIFRDAKTFGDALQAVAAGELGFGNHAPWARLLDPYCDGLGRKRSGEVMRDYIIARDRGLGCDDALKDAVAAHATRYGAESVVMRLDQHNRLADRLWQDIRRLHYPDWPEDFPFTGTLPTPARSDATRPERMLYLPRRISTVLSRLALWSRRSIRFR